MSQVWPVIHAERAALLADLRTLTPQQWQTPSACDGWTVRDVVAHIIATARMTPVGFFTGFLGSGFDFTRFNARNVARERGAGTDDQLAALESVQDSTSHPPGPLPSWLGETIVHAEDVRRPLGISRSYPTDAVVRLADFYRGSNLIVGAKRRIDGLRLSATDADWTNGSGSLVSGPVLSLVLAMTGRKAALDDLTGPGVASLRARP
jgi:uncharacterized protein (TIGR03083 family)